MAVGERLKKLGAKSVRERNAEQYRADDL